jgi:hypothetical protein
MFWQRNPQNYLDHSFYNFFSCLEVEKLGLFPSSVAKGVRRILIFGSLTDNTPNGYPNTGVSPLFLPED